MKHVVMCNVQFHFSIDLDETNESEEQSEIGPDKTPPVLQKRKAVKSPTPADDVDAALVDSVRGLHELAKSRTSATPGPDVNFCLEIADRLKSFPRHKNAFAKMRIQQVLYEVEFGEETEMAPPVHFPYVPPTSEPFNGQY